MNLETVSIWKALILRQILGNPCGKRLLTAALMRMSSRKFLCSVCYVVKSQHFIKFQRKLMYQIVPKYRECNLLQNKYDKMRICMVAGSSQRNTLNNS